MCDLQGTEPGTVFGKHEPQDSLINKWKPKEKFYYYCWIKKCATGINLKCKKKFLSWSVDIQKYWTSYIYFL